MDNNEMTSMLTDEMIKKIELAFEEENATPSVLNVKEMAKFKRVYDLAMDIFNDGKHEIGYDLFSVTKKHGHIFVIGDEAFVPCNKMELFFEMMSLSGCVEALPTRNGQTQVNFGFSNLSTYIRGGENVD